MCRMVSLVLVVLAFALGTSSLLCGVGEVWTEKTGTLLQCCSRHNVDEPGQLQDLATLDETTGLTASVRVCEKGCTQSFGTGCSGIPRCLEDPFPCDVDSRSVDTDERVLEFNPNSLYWLLVLIIPIVTIPFGFFLGLCCGHNGGEVCAPIVTAVVPCAACWKFTFEGGSSPNDRAPIILLMVCCCGLPILVLFVLGLACTLIFMIFGFLPYLLGRRITIPKYKRKVEERGKLKRERIAKLIAEKTIMYLHLHISQYEVKEHRGHVEKFGFRLPTTEETPCAVAGILIDGTDGKNYSLFIPPNMRFQYHGQTKAKGGGFLKKYTAAQQIRLSPPVPLLTDHFVVPITNLECVSRGCSPTTTDLVLNTPTGGMMVATTTAQPDVVVVASQPNVAAVASQPRGSFTMPAQVQVPAARLPQGQVIHQGQVMIQQPQVIQQPGATMMQYVRLANGQIATVPVVAQAQQWGRVMQPQGGAAIAIASSASGVQSVVTNTVEAATKVRAASEENRTAVSDDDDDEEEEAESESTEEEAEEEWESDTEEDDED